MYISTQTVVRQIAGYSLWQAFANFRYLQWSTTKLPLFNLSTEKFLQNALSGSAECEVRLYRNRIFNLVYAKDIVLLAFQYVVDCLKIAIP